MAIADFIPAGRTSRIVKGDKELQIQTEYAYRPHARLTTSIISNGQVIQKIQKDLVAPIASIEEKFKVEGLLRKQHMDVLEIIRSKDYSPELQVDRAEPFTEKKPVTLMEKLAAINGVERVFRIDNDGKFNTADISEEFQRQFSSVFKSLFEIIGIFGQLPGGKRESGVYEIEPHRLYFVSGGHECYFLLTRRVIRENTIEIDIQSVLKE
nr:hypothetical protein [candidate division Zixibacteria bacterium]